MKESFIIRKKYQEQIKLLNTEQKAQLLDAIFHYQTNWSPPDWIDPLVSMLLSVMTQDWVKDDEQYKVVCQRNQKNWKKGWRPNKNFENSQKPSGSSENPEKPKKADNDSDNDNDLITSSNEEVNKNKNKNKNKINKKNKTKKIWYSPKFEEFRKAYPLKKGKQKAFQAWTSAIKWGNDPNLIIKKAWEYTLEIKHKKTEECYIKRAQGRLNDGRWDDEYDTWKTYSWVLNTDETY